MFLSDLKLPLPSLTSCFDIFFYGKRCFLLHKKLDKSFHSLGAFFFFFPASSDPFPFRSICSSRPERVGNGCDREDTGQGLQQHPGFVWPLWWDGSQRPQQPAWGRLHRGVEVQSHPGDALSSVSNSLDGFISLQAPLMTWQRDLLNLREKPEDPSPSQQHRGLIFSQHKTLQQLPREKFYTHKWCHVSSCVKIPLSC